MAFYGPYHFLFRGLVTVCFFVCLPVLLCAQETQRFNRFQYHKFHWKVYHGKKFHIYFPADAADSVYRFVLKETPTIIDEIEKATIKQVPQDMNIIVYPSIHQQYETNIGAFEPLLQTLPTFARRATRVVLAYNGSYADLKCQLREGVARALWETELNADGVGEQVRSTFVQGKKMEDIPMWYQEGSIRFFAHGWTVEAEDRLRNSFVQNKFKSWEEVLSYQPRLGGHAFCYFVSRKYYKMAVAQTFFQVIKMRSLAKGIRLVAKCPLDTLYAQCFEWYQQRFAVSRPQSDITSSALMIPHKKGVVSNVLVNAGKSRIAYVALADGRRTVYIYDMLTQKTSKIASYKLPPWISEHTLDQYPLLAWHSDNRTLYAAYPAKGKIRIKSLREQGRRIESVVLSDVDGITSLQPMNDKAFLLSAYKSGQSDIVSYDHDKDRYMAYTDDLYDDSSPVVVSDSEIAFVSDRPLKYEQQRTYYIGVGYRKDTLWQGLYTVKGKQIVPVVADTLPYIQWRRPRLLKGGSMLLTTTKYGAEQFVALDRVKGKETTLANYRSCQYTADDDKLCFFEAGKDSIHISAGPMAEFLNEVSADTLIPWLTDYLQMNAEQAAEDSLLHAGEDTTHYFMDDVFKPRPDTVVAGKGRKKKKAVKQKTDGVEKYILQLHSAYFTAQVNNDYFINRYQPYAGYQGQFKVPEISGMTKGGFTDLLENHHFTVAYALPAATEGSTFFTRYLNTEKMVDWGFAYFRKVESLKPDPKRNWVDENGNPYPNNAKVKTHYYEVFAKYPLTYDCDLGMQIAVRKDRTVFLATDKYTLGYKSLEAAWSINTLSFHLNKLKKTIPYLYKGFKVDAYTDFFKGISHENAFVFGSNLHVRHDQPLYKYITLVSQLHLGYSAGQEKVLYNLGGVDNNVTPRVDTTVHFAQNAPYAFQTLVTPFRGYYQNTAYGNQYMLLNADVYFPIFQTLIPITTPLPFINNLQLGMLADIATAKETSNASNVNNDKWKWAYGLSMRSSLAGYPLRLEVAWPGTFSKQPVWYFSLNLM